MVGLFALSSVAFAQEPAGAVTNEPEPDPVSEAAQQAYEAEWQREFESRSVFDFNIAYLVKEGSISPDRLESSESLATMIGAQPFYSWDSFLTQNEQTPFQIILIHDSLYDQIDHSVTQHAYRNQVIIIGIGMPFEHLVEITGDHCQKNPNPHLAKEADKMVLYFTYIVNVADESLRPTIDQAFLDNCSEKPDIGDAPVTVETTATNPLISDLSYPGYLAGLIVSETIDYSIEKSISQTKRQ